MKGLRSIALKIGLFSAPRYRLRRRPAPRRNGASPLVLSYQHGFHAGNPADVHKHAFVLALLSLLVKKARPLTYVESHAGRGR